jgi:SAM-dependent methyltransferase
MSEIHSLNSLTGVRVSMITERIISYLRSQPHLKENLRKILGAVRYETADWVRVVMYRQCFEFIGQLQPDTLDVMEISAGPQWVREFNFRSFTNLKFPDFDVCAQTVDRQFDLIIADQIFEHLRWPYRAGRNVLSMLKPGGHFIIATPFLVRIHKAPIDCCRWTEDGLSFLLQECGFPADGIKTSSWGNRACVKRNLNSWRKGGFFGSLINEPAFPVMVWAFARKPDLIARAPPTSSEVS